MKTIESRVDRARRRHAAVAAWPARLVRRPTRLSEQAEPTASTGSEQVLPQRRGDHGVTTTQRTDGAAVAPEATTESDTAARTVLIVDDIAETRELLHWQLSNQANLQVVGEADDGASGVTEALRLRPDVVILDLYMPGSGGLETLADLKALLPRTAVVVITSYDSLEAHTTAMDLGAACYIVKGTRRADFLKLVREAAGL